MILLGIFSFVPVIIYPDCLIFFDISTNKLSIFKLLKHKVLFLENTKSKSSETISNGKQLIKLMLLSKLLSKLNVLFI